MNPQKKFIKDLLKKAEDPLPKEAQEIEIGYFRGGARAPRERSIDSNDFEMKESKPKKSTVKKKADKPTVKRQYKRKTVGRLKTQAF